MKIITFLMSKPLCICVCLLLCSYLLSFFTKMAILADNEDLGSSSKYSTAHLGDLRDQLIFPSSTENSGNYN